jgi:hypothetical protein
MNIHPIAADYIIKESNATTNHAGKDLTWKDLIMIFTAASIIIWNLSYCTHLPLSILYISYLL